MDWGEAHEIPSSLVLERAKYRIDQGAPQIFATTISQGGGRHMKISSLAPHSPTALHSEELGCAPTTVISSWTAGRGDA